MTRAQVGRALPTAYKGGPPTTRPVLIENRIVGRIVPVRELGRARGWEVYGAGDFHLVPDLDWQPSPGYADYLARNSLPPESQAHCQVADWFGEQVRYPGKLLYSTARLADAIAWAQEWDGWPIHYWVAMWGSYGCLPDTRECCSSRAGALSLVVDGLELGDGRRGREFRRQGYVDLGLKYGAQYAEIVACPCEICHGRTIADSEAGECERCAD